MRIFITKYALTGGIRQIEANEEDIKEDGTIFTKENGLPVFIRKSEWVNTKKEALEVAEEMRKKKIAALKKKIEKLEKRSSRYISWRKQNDRNQGSLQYRHLLLYCIGTDGSGTDQNRV